MSFLCDGTIKKKNTDLIIFCVKDLFCIFYLSFKVYKNAHKVKEF